MAHRNETKRKKVLKLGEKVQFESHPVELETASGDQIRYWDISCWPQRDENQVPIGICMSFIEATERYTSSQQREEFLETLVHDLKTPLIGAERTLEAMLKGAIGPVDSSHEQMLSVLQNSNRSLLTMVQSMIDRHRHDSEFLNLKLHKLRLPARIRECTEELRVLFNSYGLQLKYYEDPGLDGLCIEGDRMALRRVILNILDNALKFTPYSGQVTLKLHREGNDAVLDISDTGIGIANEDLEKIFAKSFQGSVGRSMTGSAGIGLFMCRKVVREHKGDITVAANPEGGSIFSLRLPLHTSETSKFPESVHSELAEFKAG